MGLTASPGTTVGITATAPATFDAAGYQALSFTTIGNVTDISEYGTNYDTILFNPLGERRTQKFKGNYNEGAATITYGLDFEDAGQNLLRTGVDLDADYHFVINLPNGDQSFFSGLITSTPQSVAASSVVTGTSVIEINTRVINETP